MAGKATGKTRGYTGTSTVTHKVKQTRFRKKYDNQLKKQREVQVKVCGKCVNNDGGWCKAKKGWCYKEFGDIQRDIRLVKVSKRSNKCVEVLSKNSSLKITDVCERFIEK